MKNRVAVIFESFGHAPPEISGKHPEFWSTPKYLRWTVSMVHTRIIWVERFSKLDRVTSQKPGSQIHGIAYGRP
jgi:hypothetical protein